MPLHEIVQQLPPSLGLAQGEHKLERACLLRLLTWDILVRFVDVELTGLSVVVGPRMACRGMSSQLPNMSFRKGAVW